MQRICNSLQLAGFDVLLVGVKRKKSILLIAQKFNQKRIKIYFEKSFLFYAEYNIKLFFYLLFTKTNAICAIDLDTIIPCFFASIIQKSKRVYDAHELFTELNEVINNKPVFWFWKKVEQFFVPRFKYGYTVNEFIQAEFKRRYQSDFEVVRNLPMLKAPFSDTKIQSKKFIIYQGAVNYGRGFNELIVAMKLVDTPLYIFGIGNYYSEVEKLITDNKLSNKVILKGNVLPNDLENITPTAKFGITIFEREGMNQYYSLANRFFDYMMAGIPQICVAYPEYKKINDEYNIALLVENIEPETLSKAINELLNNEELYSQLKTNCLKARIELNWQHEEKKLIQYWKSIFI